MPINKRKLCDSNKNNNITYTRLWYFRTSRSFKNFAEKHKGLVLVTGPTGSGKSTTLASLINIINENQQRHIITLEDPIEYVHDHKQSLVKPKRNRTRYRKF